MPRLVLLPSPSTRAVAWGRLPQALATAGATVSVVEPDDEDLPPFAARWVASCALQIGALPPGPVAVVGHSGAGPLLAQVGAALRSAHRPVAAYAFVDAGLPTGFEGSRLDQITVEDRHAAAELTELLESGGRYPQWSVEELASDVPGEADRLTLVAGSRPRDLAYWTEPLPPPTDWPDAPCVYLRTSAGYAAALRQARLRGWPTAELELGHFPGFVDAEATGHALLALVDGVTAG